MFTREAFQDRICDLPADIPDGALACQQHGPQQQTLGKLRLRDPLGGVARIHMTDFMRHDPGQLCLAGRQGDQTARYIAIPARKGESIDNPGIDDGKTIGEFLIFRMLGQTFPQFLDIGIQGWIVIFTAKGFHQFRVLLCADLLVIVQRTEPGQRALPSCAIGRTPRQSSRRRA